MGPGPNHCKAPFTLPHLPMQRMEWGIYAMSNGEREIITLGKYQKFESLERLHVEVSLKYSGGLRVRREGEIKIIAPVCPGK